MTSVNELINAGNDARANRNPQLALDNYIQAIGLDHKSAAAWNNFGNVVREMGEPDVGIPFLKKAIKLDPGMETAQFNLAVAYLLDGDYENGWPQYEKRWDYEHLKDKLPRFQQPRWTGQDLKDKTIFVLSEQGHGDTIQFVRYCEDLKKKGARVIFHAEPNVAALLEKYPHIDQFTVPSDPVPEFDYWTPVMSLAGLLGVTLSNMQSQLRYLLPDGVRVKEWLERLGPKKKMRIGFCWSGRRDTWIHLHKSVPFPVILDLVKRTPQYEWVNLQIDASEEESQQLAEAGALLFPGTITSFADTAALMETCLLYTSPSPRD